MTETPIDLFKGLPRRFQIGSYTFRMKVVPPDHVELGGNNGLTDAEQAVIYINQDIGIARCLEVVQHELTHAINWVYGVKDESDEETFTTQHSKGLVDLGMKHPRWKTWENKMLRTMRKQASKD